MPVTMKQIAMRSGVSRPTVSLVLNGKDHEIGPETRRRVREVARKMGYRPNAAARAMREGHFGNIAVLVSTHQNRSTLPDEVLAGIDEGLAERNLHLTIARLSDPQLSDPRRLPKLLREYIADGLLVNYYQQAPPSMESIIADSGMPSVWLNVKRDVDCVHPDDEAGAREATERLLAMGHRRVIYAAISGSTHYSVTDRHLGYAAAMKDAGLTPQTLTDGYVPRESRVARVAQTLQNPDERPTAIVAHTRTEATAVMFAALSLGLEVGRDVSLVSFEGQAMNLADTWIDTMLVPEFEMGREAVQLLYQRIDDSGRPHDALAVPLGFHAGSSSGPTMQ